MWSDVQSIALLRTGMYYFQFFQNRDSLSKTSAALPLPCSFITLTVMLGTSKSGIVGAMALSVLHDVRVLSWEPRGVQGLHSF